MADVIKVLGQLNPAATTPTDLYTVPSVTVTTTSSLIVCNQSAAAKKFRVSVRDGGETAANKQYLFYDKSVAANDSYAAVLGLTLNEGDVVTVYAEDANLSFNLFGVETS